MGIGSPLSLGFVCDEWPLEHADNPCDAFPSSSLRYVTHTRLLHQVDEDCSSKKEEQDHRFKSIRHPACEEHGNVQLFENMGELLLGF